MSSSKEKKSKRPKPPKSTPKTDKATARRVKRVKATTSPTTQNSILYTSLFEDGLMHVVDNVYSRTYSLGMVNYVTATHEEKQNIIAVYNDAINTLSDLESFQLTLKVTKVEKAEFVRETAYALKGDTNDVYRGELNNIIQHNYDEGLSNFKQERYITISTENDIRQRAATKLKNVATLFAANLANIEVPFDELDGLERLKLINSLTRPGYPLHGGYKEIAQSHLTTKDFIAPTSLKFEKNQIELDEKFAQILYLRDFPFELSDGLFKEISESNVECTLTIHAKPYSISQTNKQLRNQATVVETDIVNQQIKASQLHVSTDLISRNTKEAKSDLDELIEFVHETGDKQMSSVFLVEILADTPDRLREYSDIVRAVGDKYGAVFVSLQYMQEEGFNSVLPFGKNYTDVERTLQRDLITPNISINSPFTLVDLRHTNGKYYGVNQLSNNIITVNRKDRSMNNGNGLMGGVSGAGKSFTIKHEIITTLFSTEKDEIIIIDPEDEYSVLGRQFGAELVTIAPKSKTHINLLDLPADSDAVLDEDPIALKSASLISLFSLLFPLSPTQESIIDSVLNETYEQIAHPTLQDWYQNLEKRISDPDANQLYKILEMYVTGSLDIFSHETNVNLSSRFIVYNIKQMRGKFKPFAVMVLIDNIWNRAVENQRRGITTWLYCDEIHMMVASNQPRMLRAIFQEMWARFRKYRVFPTGISQSMETFLSTEEGRAMFFNSDFMILLKQKTGDVFDLIVESLRLTPEQHRFLRNPPKGGGLIVAGSTVVPFTNTIPKDTHIYEVLQTDA